MLILRIAKVNALRKTTHLQNWDALLMLYTLLTWNSLIVTSYMVGSVGLLVFNRSKLNPLAHSSPGLVLILWLGISLQCLGVLALGLVTPLVPVLLPVLSIILFLITRLLVIRFINFPQQFISLKNHVSRLWAIALPLILCELVWSILISRPIVWFDTGLYHLGSIRWLSHYGFVPGMALINEKFGFISSWFAFSASMTPPFLGDRIGPISNGFLLVLISCTILIMMDGLKREETLSLGSTFLAVFLTGLTAFYLVSWVADKPILISFSHDVPINYMVGIFAWSLLLISSKAKSPSPNYIQSTFDLALLPLVLSFSILSVKLTGLFLPPIAFLFYLCKDPFNLRRWVTGIAISLILVMPLAIAQIITSGCLLYPSQSFCLNVPWRVPAEWIASEAEPIVGGGFIEFSSGGWWIAISQTIQVWTDAFLYDPKVMGGTLLLVATISLIIGRVFWKTNKPPGENWVFATAICGALFVFLINKYVIFRFGGGILLLLPTYAVALCLHRWYLNRSRIYDFQSIATQFIRILTLTLWAVLAAIITTNPIAIRQAWLLPLPLPQPELIEAQTNNVYYTYPDQWTVKCWAAELPCAPTPRQGLHLRRPAQGLGGGMIYLDSSL